MKKKEIRWASRDNAGGRHDLWMKKPHKTNGAWFGAENEPHAVGSENDLAYDFITETGILLKEGGLAKITIERQY